MSIIDYWDLPMTPRPAQIDALKWIEQNQDKKYLFCLLPVGTGKSALPVVTSNWLRQREERPTSFILTPQKILQAQYEESFKFSGNIMTSLYGKSNYKCRSKNTTCNIGGILAPKCPNCPHNAVKAQAKRSCDLVLNYKLALTLFNYTEMFEKRQLIALDECHNVEAFLTEFNSATITYHRCEQYGVKWCNSMDVTQVYNWILTEYSPKINEVAEIMSEECEYLIDTPAASLSPEDLKQLQRWHALNEHLAEIDLFIKTPIDHVLRKFVMIKDKTQIKFKYLYGKDNFHTILKPFGDQLLFMSATPNYKETCASLDIPLEQTAFFSADSDFPAENRPVYFLPTLKMNYQWLEDSNEQGRANLIDAIISIANTHDEHSGIIHTGNFQIATWLTEQLEGKIPHEIFHHNPDSGSQRNKVIEAFNTLNKPSLLISPSITEGLDLIHDRARFAIFAKIPFGSLGDAWIKRRMELSSEWYLTTALTDVLQGCGRVVRSKEDWGSVYILDASWSYLYNNTKHVIPDWWKEAYHS